MTIMENHMERQEVHEKVGRESQCQNQVMSIVPCNKYTLVSTGV